MSTHSGSNRNVTYNYTRTQRGGRRGQNNYQNCNRQFADTKPSMKIAPLEDDAICSEQKMKRAMRFGADTDSQNHPVSNSRTLESSDHKEAFSQPLAHKKELLEHAKQLVGTCTIIEKPYIRLPEVLLYSI